MSTEVETIQFVDMAMEPYLREAMGIVCRRHHTSNNSIQWGDNGDGSLEIKVRPTQAWFMYALFFEMGRLYERKNGNDGK